MKVLPLVSVIVPVFNAGSRLLPTIESLLAQNLTAIEIIIVNDASTDNSHAVIDQLARASNNIVPIHLYENKGAHEARLAGLKKATAPWIGFLDADDFARPNMFSTLYAAAIDNDVDIVICGSDRVTEQRKLIAQKLQFQRSNKVDNYIFERFCRFEFGTGMLWNKLFKRSVIEPWFNLHFPWRQNINEDLILNAACFYLAKSVYVSKDILHEYTLNKASVTSTAVNTQSYVSTYKAAALAISIFCEFGSQSLSKVIDMYRTQLSWHDYLIDDITSMEAYEDDIKEAVDLIYRTHPSALSLLSARKPQDTAKRKTSAKLFYKFLAFMKPGIISKKTIS